VSGLLGAAVLVPLGGAVLASLLPARAAAVTGLTAAATAATAALATVQVATTGTLDLELAGWGAPLGIDLRADGLSATLLLLTAAVGAVVTAYATGPRAARGQEPFWPLWLLLWAGLNAVYVSGDLFNTYVALELLGLAAVALVAQGGRDSLAPALRYLFVAVLGSLAYLLGVALVFAETGTLDVAIAADSLDSGTSAVVALGAMTVGLALKTALFPLHAWLPPAHSAAPAAVSALLSALVVKASFYVLVRLWFTVYRAEAATLTQALGVLGAAAVVWGGVQALRQQRLKRVVAYSTVAQVGYLFLIFPLAAPGVDAGAGTAAAATAVAGWTGALAVAVAHGLAKSAMFLTAGTLAAAHGTDQLDRLRGAASRMPMSGMAFALAAITLAGLPPTLGFVGKWQLLQASLGSGQWWWVPVLLGGGLLTIAYTARAMKATFRDQADDDEEPPELRPVPRRLQVAPLGLALAALLLGLTAVPLLDLTLVGSPWGGS
jgi:multicomponent Na+:H+ antiporter subunit D